MGKYLFHIIYQLVLRKYKNEGEKTQKQRKRMKKTLIISLLVIFSISIFAQENHIVESENLSLIQKISTGRDVVFAWGTDTIGGKRNYPNYYDNAIRNITSTIVNNTYYANRCKCKNSSCTTPSHSQIRYPLHGLAWCNHSTLIAY